ncbi:GerAB/ArcD/ProY family transporter [Alicyclobacillus macrosporangiidus]|uniref:Spore germination protein KB n=1 Tax=Alicyclobacillus macrosporangiidus TaxID=392015 RepID=A0A1I7J5A4_9BACL|nr:endospore germination permease [Alicyclobacillus macrosporangiidus]SFU80317.1 spore germination protein KB [Alicyclobacillus macrosporangiidus]
MSNVQISRFQMVIMLIWSILGTGIVTVPYVIAQFTVRDSWITGLLFAAGGLLSAGVAAVFLHALPNRNLTSGLIDAFGPWLGRMFGLWFLVWLYLINCTALREAESFVSITILPETPEYIVGLLAMAGISYMVYMGAEVPMRDGEFITPLAIIVAPLLFALSMQHMDVHQLMPVLADGWQPILRGAMTPDLTFALEMLISLQFVRALRVSQTLPKDMITATAIITVLLTCVLEITTGVVGQSTSYLSYPVLETVRSIRVGRFLERLDTLYVMGVMSTVCLKLGVFHYAWCEGMKDVFKLSSHRIVAYSGALFVWAGSFAFFRSTQEMEHFIAGVAPAYFVLTLICIPLLAAMVMNFRRRVKR